MLAPATAALAALALAVTLAACRPSDRPDPTAAPAVATAGVSLIVAEQAGDETAFWSVPATEPADRRLIARVAHDPEWGVRAALSPDGRTIAYTFMPPGARSPDREAALAVLDTASRRVEVLARGVDLRTAPLWTRPRGPLVAQRTGPTGAGELIAVGMDRAITTILSAGRGQRLVPIAPAPSGAALYVAELGEGGTTLMRVPSQGAATDIAALSAGPARGFVLDPKGATLAFLRLRGADGRYEAAALDLRSGDLRALRPDRPRLEDTGVIWRDGWLVTATTEGGGGVLLAAGPGDDHVRADGFDAPAASSAPDGWLALRSFSGGDARAPGSESLTLLRGDGRRSDLPGGVAVGWSRS